MMSLFLVIIILKLFKVFNVVDFYILKIKSILIREYQYKSTRVNTNQQESKRVWHESTRVRHESTRINTSPTQVNTNQHESDTRLTQVNTSLTRVNTNQQEPKTSLDHKKQNKYG